MAAFDKIKSGLDEFDKIIKNIRLGDNVVWRISDLNQYRNFIDPFVKQAISENRTINYMRFAKHEPLIEPQDGVEIHYFNYDDGFESFTVQIHELITQKGLDALYVFDLLSELQGAWMSDLMVGNFFRVTCPYLFELDTVAYFALLRDSHSMEAVAQIRETTQLFFDLFSDNNSNFVLPLKVWRRHSSTMFLPHLIEENGAFRPLTDSVESGKFYAIANQTAVNSVDSSLDHWDHLFIEAKKNRESTKFYDKLQVMLVGREPQLGALIKKHFELQDFLNIRERMIGTGAIGGKAIGLLLARKIVSNCLPELQSKTEPHDSFYVGADVFYSFLVYNGWWKLRVEQQTPEGFFSVAAKLRKKLLAGDFPEKLREQFRSMLEYFGQSPIIVRSSSLLEDSFGNTFAGKYESVFCVNTGSPEDRLEMFEDAVRQVYASTMDDSALAYRQKWNLDCCDEQMGLLVQRVSGSIYEDYFMPCVAGVGYSYNAYAWNEEIDPTAGMLRIVGGLGTRAVDRVESDYPRLAALDNPLMMTVSDAEDRARFSQRYLDILDLDKVQLRGASIDEITKVLPVWLQNLIFEHDTEAERYFSNIGKRRNVFYCNCEEVLKREDFVSDMRQILHTLEQEYTTPVDIEFTANFAKNGEYMINLLQCRPLRLSNEVRTINIPEFSTENALFSLHGDVMGGSVDIALDYVIMVDPEIYVNSSLSAKYTLARTIGVLNRQLGADGGKILLAGPGRWGTSSPELGVPVVFAEISNVAVICELSYVAGDIMPELSYGSHFFQDLIENEMFYVAIFGHSLYQPDLLEQFEKVEFNCPEELPKNLLTIYNVKDRLALMSDMATKQSVCAIF